jgi:three-Cys-motif partner protein
LTTAIDVQQRRFAESVKSIFPGKPPKFDNRKDNAYLVVLDPYGFQVDWDNLKWILQSGAVDLIITFHTRLASWNQNKSQSKPALTRMFGNEDWLSCTTEDDFMKLYCERIHSIPVTWRSFETKTLTVQRDSGKYHLICASRAPGAKNVFDDIQEKFDSVDNKLLTKIFDTSLGDQSKMDGFFGL